MKAPIAVATPVAGVCSVLCACRVRPSRPPDPTSSRSPCSSSPNSLDPRIGSDEMSQRVHQLVYDNLLELDDQLRVIGGLATQLGAARSAHLRRALRKGVRFHDGHELTADDVVYTFGSFIDPAFVSPRKGAYRTLDRVEAIDPYTVRFTLKEPFGSFPIQLVMPVVPKGAGRNCAITRSAPGPTSS